jgi:hypothetical protein
MKKSILTILLCAVFAAPMLAQEKPQDQAAAARAAAGCGPSEITFDVKTDKKQHPLAQPEAGKALVYVFEDEKRDNNVNYFGSVTTRVGLDGAWVGANHGKSYLFFTVDPGEHNLCANWQSSFGRLSKQGSAAAFTTEAGKVYYFRTRVDERAKHEPEVRLEAIDSAEGQLLISSSAYSTSRAKK